MSYDLRNRGESYSCHGDTWGNLFRLALLGGWEPEGTKLHRETVRQQLQSKSDLSPEDLERESRNIEESWEGTYFSNDWQIVNEDDALNMTTALESALCHIPLRRTDESIRFAQTVAKKREGFTEVSIDNNPLIIFAGPYGRTQVQEFINFTKMGGFTIS